MTKCGQVLVIALLSFQPGFALGEALPHGAQAISSEDTASSAYISSAWPANELQAVVTEWSDHNQAAIDEEARAVLVALDLQAEYRTISTLGISSETTRAASKRALAHFLNDEISYDTVTSFEALISSELGRNPISIAQVNRVGIVNFPSGTTSVLVKSIDGGVEKQIANATKFVAATGQYSFKLTVNGALCEKVISIGAGQSDTLTCP